MDSKYKILLIAVYFGEFPPEFNLWLKSCENNADIHFLLCTDQDMIYIPDNMLWKKMSLEDCQKMFLAASGMNIVLTRPYKMCDYRPLYGKVFKEELRGYDFWGHCDIDMVWGNIRTFLTDNILDCYDRIGSFGHMSLYRNNKKMNNLYKKKGSAFSYKKVFQSEYNYNFDEMYGMNLICSKNKVKWMDFRHAYCLDKKGGDKLAFYGIKNYNSQKVLWMNGKIYRVFIKNGKVKFREFMYYHFSGIHYAIDSISDKIVFGNDYCNHVEDEIKSVFCYNEGISAISQKNWIYKWKHTNFIQKYIALRQKLSAVCSLSRKYYHKG